jgi:hypothetical protein
MSGIVFLSALLKIAISLEGQSSCLTQQCPVVGHGSEDPPLDEEGTIEEAPPITVLRQLRSSSLIAATGGAEGYPIPQP